MLQHAPTSKEFSSGCEFLLQSVQSFDHGFVCFIVFALCMEGLVVVGYKLNTPTADMLMWHFSCAAYCLTLTAHTHTLTHACTHTHTHTHTHLSLSWGDYALEGTLKLKNSVSRLKYMFVKLPSSSAWLFLIIVHYKNLWVVHFILVTIAVTSFQDHWCSEKVRLQSISFFSFLKINKSFLIYLFLI